MNAMEAIVLRTFEDEFLPRVQVCKCDQCRDDVLAWTLNQFPSRYVSTDKGQAYVKAQLFDNQLRSDILRELTIAARMVAQNPRHSTGSPKFE